MAQEAPLQTVSLAVQETTRNQQRQSLPARVHQNTNNALQRPNSFTGGKTKIALQPVIPEVDAEEESSGVKV
ncbi:hypothetical protein RN001_014870 [Aquatica leii]|uniref:Uncharacterized protein n=1 Tax=Aquatica leii TaxID=1421715 RepID=A0AAN7P2I9_9COLE|nr:hypothetical protein RN001_014870 [Aquatica leii]